MRSQAASLVALALSLIAARATAQTNSDLNSGGLAPPPAIES